LIGCFFLLLSWVKRLSDC